MSVLIQRPYNNPLQTITLPNPVLKDSDTFKNKTSLAFSMSGDIYSFKQTPAVRVLLLTFNNIDDCGTGFSTYPAIVSFLKTYAGEKLRLVDWMGNIWVGIILNNPAEFTARNKTFYTLTIQFEGIITLPA